MFNLKSNFWLAGLISATTLLAGAGFGSGALALTNSEKDSYHSSSSPQYHCP